MEYHIRYTCSGELQQEIVKFIMKNAQKCIISREFASKEHIQCYVETNITKKTWVNKFNLKFKSMDRRDKYVMPDKGETIRYVCKGKSDLELPDVVAKMGFSEDNIKNFHTEYWLRNPVRLEPEPSTIISLPELNEMVVPKVKRIKKPTFMKEVRNELEDEYPDLEWDMKHKSIVFKKIMYKLGEGCRNLDHIIISRMTYGVLNSLIKDKKEWLEYWYMKAFSETLNCDDENYELDE